MKYPSDTSMMADPDFPAPQGALPVWIKVFTKPSERTFLEVIDHPEAKARSAYIWVFLVGTLSALISSLVQFVGTLIGLQQIAPDFGQVQGLPQVIGTAGLLGAVCGAPIAGVFSVIFFAIFVGVVHATARFFGGQGSFDKLAYAFGAVAAPLSLISGVATILSIIPFVGLCTFPVLLLILLYSLFLYTTAVKAVNRCGWGEAAAALLLPVVLLGLLCGFASLLLVRAAGPSINEFLQQLQQVR